MPLLVCLADHDLEASSAFALKVAKQAPQGEVRRYPVGHFDVYVEPVRSQIIADQVAFLCTHSWGPRPCHCEAEDSLAQQEPVT
jgi:hypothetical protein